MAQLILQHTLQSVQQRRLYRVFRQILDRATLFAGVKERDFLPRRQIGEDRMRGGVGFITEHMFDLAAHPQMRHHMLKAQLAVKVCPANAHPFAGEDMNARVTFLPEKGKIRRTAPDIDDQPQIAGFKHGTIGQSRGLGFGHEADLLEPGLQIAFGQIHQRLRVPRRIGTVEHHRSP